VDTTYTPPAPDIDARRSRALMAGPPASSACAIFVRRWRAPLLPRLAHRVPAVPRHRARLDGFVMIQHLTGGSWGVFRRIFEASSRTLPLLACSSSRCCSGCTPVSVDPRSHVADDPILQMKSIYLNTPFFLAPGGGLLRLAGS
jgi:hypothetical protein